ncbi:tubulin/FtsZ-like protein [Erwinia phage AH04]|uniref:Tubulin/FtsZ-like protein n=1 Tax=Erwinia phage AH04 TaxID=2869569 RepID=A0AAE7X0H4_9CAUD|nr:tubulin PhuZ [Erwinia phage AH04]QZA70537.1 tubulin/FtsZ-like protein [Erwinia phage AH04]
MKDFNIYAVGGTGINIANRFLKDNRNGRAVDTIVGFDTSSANPVSDGLFNVERVPDAEGSGGNKKAHADKYPDFAKQMLAKYPPNRLNIVVFSTGGGTGASLGPWIVRNLLQRKVPVLAIVIGDRSSYNEHDNTIGTLGSLYNQTKLGHSVLFSYIENKPTVTQGDVNANAAARIDNAIMLFSMENERIDYADVFNFFFYTTVVDADPVLTQLTFLTDNDVGNYKSKPVAALSLYADADQIKSPFEDLLYRKAGIYGETYRGITQTTHAVLDHGDTLENLKEMINNKAVKTDQLAGQFRNKGNLNFGGNADDDGMM